MTVMDYADGTTNTFRAIGEGAADYPPSNLIAFSEWLAQTIAQIPEAHRSTAYIELNSM